MEALTYVIPVLAAVSAGLFVWAGLRQIAWTQAHDKPTELEALRRSERQTAFESDVGGTLLMPFFYIARALPTPRLRDKVAQRLVLAGNPNFYSPDEQLALACASACLMALVTGVLAFLNMPRIGPTLAVAMAFGLLVGFYTPLMMLSAEGRRRMKTIAKSLPYALDLISLTMGAGATFTEAVKTMVRGRTDDPLADEFRRLLAEIEFGTPRPAALAKMAERIPSDDMRNIVAGINQAETYGSSLSEILKAQAGLMRLKRSVAAEKAAAEAGVKMLLPMTLILVAVLLLVFAPAVIRWKTGRLF